MGESISGDAYADALASVYFAVMPANACLGNPDPQAMAAMIRQRIERMKEDVELDLISVEGVAYKLGLEPDFPSIQEATSAIHGQLSKQANVRRDTVAALYLEWRRHKDVGGWPDQKSLSALQTTLEKITGSDQPDEWKIQGHVS